MPAISSVGAGEEFFDGEHTSMSGTAFGAVPGTVYLYDNATLVEGSAVSQYIRSWADTLIEFDIDTGTIPDGTAYLFVKDDSAQISTAFAVSIVTLIPVGSAGLTQALMIASAEPLTEQINDLDTSTISSPAGDFRAPITKTFARIDSIIISGRNVGGGFSYDIIDKDESLGPRIKTYPSGILGDATIDIAVTGIKGTAPTASPPTISPNGGVISTADQITLSTSTTGASIYYTTDGSMPDAGSILYVAPFTLSSSAIVKAITIKSGLANSGITSASFTIGAVAVPTITPNGGTVQNTDPITLATATSGATIYYTTDNSTPTTSSTLYSGSFTLSADATVKAFAVKSGLTDSAVASASFTIGSNAYAEYGEITTASGLSSLSVYEWHPTNTDGATSVTVDIYRDGSFVKSSAPFSQQVNPGQFNLLDFGTFAPGDIDQPGTYKFRITNNAQGGTFVYLDALKFEYQEL